MTTNMASILGPGLKNAFRLAKVRNDVSGAVNALLNRYFSFDRGFVITPSSQEGGGEIGFIVRLFRKIVLVAHVDSYSSHQDAEQKIRRTLMSLPGSELDLDEGPVIGVIFSGRDATSYTMSGVGDHDRSIAPSYDPQRTLDLWLESDASVLVDLFLEISPQRCPYVVFSSYYKDGLTRCFEVEHELDLREYLYRVCREEYKLDPARLSGMALRPLCELMISMGTVRISAQRGWGIVAISQGALM